MNYYFLLEDEKSFLKVLPAWLEHMNFKCTRVADIQSIDNNNYVLQSGQGVTQLITKVLYETIDTIVYNPGKIDHLVVILDTEQEDEEYRIQQVMDKIAERYNIEEFDFEIKIFVCNHCFETWLLGNAEFYPNTVDRNSLFYPYFSHYNILENDPELMNVPMDDDRTIAKYHFQYLHNMFLYNRIRYRKSKPDFVATNSYFQILKNRAWNTSHISSFRKFVEYIQSQNNL